MKNRLGSVLLTVMMVLAVFGPAAASEQLFSDTVWEEIRYEEEEKTTGEEAIFFDGPGTLEEGASMAADPDGELVRFDDGEDPAEEDLLTEEETISCGENLRCTLTPDGTLILTGDGPMNDLGLAAVVEDPCAVTSVVLPEGMTSVGNLAFQGFTGLREIVLPQSIRKIGINAFIDCSALETVVLPEGLEDIEMGAFARCRSLREIVLPDTVTSLGMFCFLNCTALERAVLSAGLYSVSYNAFDGCSGLEEVQLPDGIRQLSDQVFYNCYSLRQIRLPETLEYIGSEVFYGCEALERIRIPDQVHSIGLGAFEYCTGLREIQLPQGLVFIDYLTFSNCESLTGIVIPEGVKKILGAAFESCYELESAVLPWSLEEIDAHAFRSCSNLTGILIPPYVSGIGAGVFDGIEDLTVYGYAGSMAEAYAQEYGFSFEPLEKDVQTLTAVTDYRKELGEGSFKLQVSTDGSGSLGFINYDPKVVSVNLSGKVTLRSAGIAHIRVYAAEGVTSLPSEPVDITIRVLPDPVQVKVLKSVKSGNLTLKWSPDPQADGYQIRCEKADGSDKAVLKLGIRNPARSSKTLSGLEKGALYSVSIRAYKNTKEGKLFGSWSPVRRITTAK